MINEMTKLQLEIEEEITRLNGILEGVSDNEFYKILGKVEALQEVITMIGGYK